MKQILEYKNCLLLLLITVFFIGCSAKGHDDKKQDGSNQTEKDTTTSNSIEDIYIAINRIEEKTVKNSEYIENIKADISKIEKQVNESSANPVKLFFVSIIINIIIIIAAFFLWMFLKRKASKNRNKRANQLNENRNLEKRVNKLSNQILKLEKDLNNANRMIESLENKKPQKIATEKKANSQIKKESKPTVNNKQPTKYLSGINGKSFTNVDTNSDGSFFVIINQKGDTAEYTFHGSDKEAIAKKIFNEQISKTLSGSQRSAKKVEVVTPGKIKQVNNYWEVTQPIEIKLI